MLISRKKFYFTFFVQNKPFYPLIFFYFWTNFAKVDFFQNLFKISHFSITSLTRIHWVVFFCVQFTIKTIWRLVENWTYYTLWRSLLFIMIIASKYEKTSRRDITGSLNRYEFFSPFISIFRHQLNIKSA